MTERITCLAAGIRWLLFEQPAGAALNQNEALLEGPDNRSYHFRPQGAFGRPVVIIKVTTPRPLLRNGRPSRVEAPLAPDELSRVAHELALLGYDVTQRWHGFPGTHGSLCLDASPHPTLSAAVATYHAGCSLHPKAAESCDCDEWRARRSRAVLPNPPTVKTGNPGNIVCTAATITRAQHAPAPDHPQAGHCYQPDSTIAPSTARFPPW